MNGSPSLAASLRRMGAAFLILAAAPLWPQPAPDLQKLLDGVEARLAAAFDYKLWTADSTTTITEFDRKGVTGKTTHVTKFVRMRDGERDEDILKAVETKDGRTTDITAKYAEESRARREKERQRRARSEKKGGRRSGAFDLDEIMPFASSKRAAFDFAVKTATAEGGRSLVILEARAKIRDSDVWNGVYTIDPATFDIVKAEVRPSKNPTFVKELWAEADIGAVGSHLVLSRTLFKIDAGFLIKHVRMIVEDTYANIRVGA